MKQNHLYPSKGESGIPRDPIGKALNTKRKNLNFKRSTLSQAVYLATAGLIISSAGTSAFANQQDFYGGGNAIPNQNYYTYLYLHAGANNDRWNTLDGYVFTNMHNVDATDKGWIKVESNLKTNSNGIGTNDYPVLMTYRFTGTDSSRLDLNGRLQVGQFESAGNLTSNHEINIIARGLLVNDNGIYNYYDGSDPVTKLGEAIISGNATFGAESYVTAHEVQIGNSSKPRTNFEVTTGGTLTLTGANTTLNSRAHTGVINVTNTDFKSAGKVQFKGATTFVNSKLNFNGDNNSHGEMTFVNATPTFKGADNKIEVGTTGSTTDAYGTLIAQVTDDFSLEHVPVIVNEKAHFKVKSKNGKVVLGKTDISGTYNVGKFDGTGNQEIDGIAVLNGPLTFKGKTEADGILTAEQFEIRPTFSVDVAQDKFGTLCASSQLDKKLDLSNTKITAQGTLTVKGKAADSLQTVVINKAELNEGGWLAIDAGLEASNSAVADDNTLKLNGSETKKAGLKAKDYSKYTGTIVTEAGKFGVVSSELNTDNKIDLTKLNSLNVEGTLFLGQDVALNSEKKTQVSFKEAGVKGVLDLTNAKTILKAPDDSSPIVNLNGNSTDTGVVRVNADNGDGQGKIAALVVKTHADANNAKIQVIGSSIANFEDVTMTVDADKSLDLQVKSADNDAEAYRHYQNIGAANAGTLRLLGDGSGNGNVDFTVAENYSGNGVVSFETPTASRTLKTDKASFEKVVSLGRFDIGNISNADTKNIFKIDGTNSDVDGDGNYTNALDLTASLNNNDGWFNTNKTKNDTGVYPVGGDGPISGDGVLDVDAATIGDKYNDKRIELKAKTLISSAETVAVGGLLTATEALKFDSVKSLDLKEGGKFTLGNENLSANSTFDLSNADLQFNGGQLVVVRSSTLADNAPVPDDSESTVPYDRTNPPTPTLKVKSLNFVVADPSNRTAGTTSIAGSLTIQKGASVQVVGNSEDSAIKVEGTIPTNANGHSDIQFVTLNGAGSMLIADAKDLLTPKLKDGNPVKGEYQALYTPGIIGGYGTLVINDFKSFAEKHGGLTEKGKPPLNVTKFIELRKELLDAGNTTANGFNVLLAFNKSDVDGFFDKNGNVDRSDTETKKWLDAGVSASGQLVTNVKKDEQSKTDIRQEWGAVKNETDNSTLIIGKDDRGNGTSKDVTLDNAGAGINPEQTDKNYFVRYDKTNPEAKDQLGNIGFIGDKATGTLVGGGVVGTISGSTTTDGNGKPSITEGVIGGNYDIVFQDSKAEPGKAPDPDNKKGFASGTIYLPTKTDPTDASNTLTGNVTADKADVVIRGENGSNGDLTSSNLIVKNDSSVKVTGKTDIDNLKLGNDSDANKAGSTNKVEFVGKADIDQIIADGSKVSEPLGGANGKAEVTFNQTGPNTVGGIFVESNNDLKVTGKVDVVGPATVHGTLSTTPDVKLNGGLDVGSTTGAPAHANIQNGSLQSTAQVGGSLGNGFLYLGSTPDTLEQPNTIGKNWADSEAALTERLPGTSYTGIGYLDENGYDISNATINIGSVARGSQGTLTVGAGGALIVTDQALTRPADGQWNYTAGMKGNIANEGGTVLIGDLHKIGNQTTIKLATGNVTESDGAQWVTKNPLYTLTLKDDGILYASFNSTASDAITGKVDKDLADIIKDQGNKDQNQGGGFDKDRKDGNGFISKVLDDTVTNENGVDFDATADRIGKTLTSSTRFAVLGGAAQNSQLASDMVTAQIEERAGFRTSTASRITTDNGEAGSLWVNPLYNKNRSGHLNADHYTYGLDADLYGMSFGGDVAVNDTFRIGAAFSGGKGNSDAVGGLMPTKNDFDFYSGSLYAITDIGSVTLLTDLDYTWLKGDVKQTNRITTLNSTLKSDVTSFGVSAKRTFEVNNGTLVAPYAGVRVNRLHINGYDVKDTDGNTIITAESQQQYYATVPVGVQVSKNIELTNGFVKPVLDLGLVTTLGSRHMESRVTYTGFGETSATSEVRDRTAFTVKFGVNAEVGNLGLGLGYGLTGSQSLTSNQVYGNVRYRF